MMETIQTQHTTEQTALLVEDYPYGFRLRCQIRYWIEWTKHGARFCSQTTNPKRMGTHWNKPKKSTYADLMVLTRNPENGHISYSSTSLEWTDEEKWTKWLERNKSALPELKQITDLLKLAPVVFEARKHIRVEIRASKPIDLFNTPKEVWDEMSAESDKLKKENQEVLGKVWAYANYKVNNA